MSVDLLGIVDAARAYLGVPWKHQGSDRSGMDCAGLLLAVAKDTGIDAPRELPRKPLPRIELFDELLPKYCDKVRDPVPGVIVRMSMAGRAQHLAVVGVHPLGHDTLIHAYMTAGKVCEHSLDAKWRRRIVSCWRIKGTN